MYARQPAPVGRSNFIEPRGSPDMGTFRRFGIFSVLDASIECVFTIYDVGTQFRSGSHATSFGRIRRVRILATTATCWLDDRWFSKFMRSSAFLDAERSDARCARTGICLLILRNGIIGATGLHAIACHGKSLIRC